MSAPHDNKRKSESFVEEWNEIVGLMDSLLKAYQEFALGAIRSVNPRAQQLVDLQEPPRLAISIQSLTTAFSRSRHDKCCSDALTETDYNIAKALTDASARLCIHLSKAAPCQPAQQSPNAAEANSAYEFVKQAESALQEMTKMTEFTAMQGKVVGELNQDKEILKEQLLSQAFVHTNRLSAEQAGFYIKAVQVIRAQEVLTDLLRETKDITEALIDLWDGQETELVRIRSSKR